MCVCTSQFRYSMIFTLFIWLLLTLSRKEKRKKRRHIEWSCLLSFSRYFFICSRFFVNVIRIFENGNKSNPLSSFGLMIFKYKIKLLTLLTFRLHSKNAYQHIHTHIHKISARVYWRWIENCESFSGFKTQNLNLVNGFQAFHILNLFLESKSLICH